MDYTNKQHVQVPHPSKWNLKALDWYIYAHIRKYMNKETFKCWPSMDTIKADSGCSLPTIRKAIANLERESAIKVTRRKKYSNVYEFTKLTEDFERITLKFLSKTEWTPETKGYIMGYLAQAYKDPVTEYAYVAKSQEELATSMNTSVSTIKRRTREMKELNIITELTSYERDEAGYNKPVLAIDMAKVCQAVLYVNEKVEKNTEDIEQLKKQLQWAMREINKLKEEKATTVEFKIEE